MPPALHPKSTQTLSLFTTTLVLSFGVVTLPHVFPCPVDHKRRMYADGENSERRRRRRSPEDSTSTSITKDTTSDSSNQPDIFSREQSKRECPVPKPTGMFGQLLGFKNSEEKPKTFVKVEISKPSDEKR